VAGDFIYAGIVGFGSCYGGSQIPSITMCKDEVKHFEAQDV